MSKKLTKTEMQSLKNLHENLETFTASVKDFEQLRFHTRICGTYILPLLEDPSKFKLADVRMNVNPSMSSVNKILAITKSNIPQVLHPFEYEGFLSSDSYISLSDFSFQIASDILRRKVTLYHDTRTDVHKGRASLLDHEAAVLYNYADVYLSRFLLSYTKQRNKFAHNNDAQYNFRREVAPVTDEDYKYNLTLTTLEDAVKIGVEKINDTPEPKIFGVS